VFENQLTNVMIRMEDASRLKKWMFDKAMAHAKRVGAALVERAIDRLYRSGKVFSG
jgi:long-chain acyl-CoA synthetase